MKEDFKTPSKEEISSYIKKHHLSVDTDFVIEYWSKKGWKTKSTGKHIKTLSSAINVANSLYLNKHRKDVIENFVSKRKYKISFDEALKLDLVKSENERKKGNFYDVWTDGSCDNINTKAGGAGYVILKENKVLKIKNKGFLNTTNNRMELLAIISAINSIPDDASMLVHTDSKYAISALKYGGLHKNQDLVSLFQKLKGCRKIYFDWIKGHNGVEYNEMADQLAFSAYQDIVKSNNLQVSRYMLKTH